MFYTISGFTNNCLFLILFFGKGKPYLVPERKLGFFVQIKPPAWRAYAPEGKTIILTAGIHGVFRGLKFESDADTGEKDSFRSGTI
jgi:hypothetical protein